MAEREEEAEGGFEYTSLPGGVDFTEIEQANTAPTVPDLNKITLEGTEVPENLRGKSVSELLSMTSGALKALEISETARKALQNSQQALEEARSTPKPAPAPAAPAAPAPLTREQLKELWDRDPFEYQEYMQTQLKNEILGSVQQSLGPMVGNTTDLVIREAKTRFPDEFAAIGTEIDQFISRLPDKSGLTGPGAMDELVNYMRGKHFSKFMDYLNSKGGNSLRDAQRATASETPTEFNRAPSAPPSRGRGSPTQLDEVEKRVAEAFGVSYEDYAKNKIIPRG